MIANDFYKISQSAQHEEMSRKEQMHLFFQFFFGLRDLIRQYETAPTLKLFKQLQELKEELAEFVFQELFSLEEDIYENLELLQDYIANYLHHKKIQFQE